MAGFEASSWYGIAAPKNTPTEIVDKLNKEINTVFSDAKIMGQLAALGGMVLAGSPEDFRKHIADQIDKWARVIKAAGIKPE